MSVEDERLRAVESRLAVVETEVRGTREDTKEVADDLKTVIKSIFGFGSAIIITILGAVIAAILTG